jgi:hypothetical protein
MSETALVLNIEGDPTELSPNAIRRMCVGKRIRLTRAWQARARQAWENAGRPTFTERVQIRFTICRPRRLDADNAAGSVKALLDGLTRKGGRLPEGMVWDDSERYVEIVSVTQMTGKLWKGREKVVVGVSPCVSRNENPDDVY